MIVLSPLIFQPAHAVHMESQRTSVMQPLGDASVKKTLMDQIVIVVRLATSTIPTVLVSDFIYVV